jgi:hypothetical protein
MAPNFYFCGSGKCEQGRSIIKIRSPETKKRDERRNGKMETTPKESKVCPQCKTEKPVSEFHKNKSNSDGLNGWCKKCTLAKQKEDYKMAKKKEENQAKVRIMNEMDFADFPDHFDWLEEQAKRNFRSPKMQILYMIDQQMSEAA